MIKYAVAMGIRMVCLILIFVVDGWLKILPIIGAVFLPWFAVIIANGSDTAEVHADSLLDSAPLAQLDAPPAGPAGGRGAVPDDPSMTVLQGELVDEDDSPTDGPGGPDVPSAPGAPGGPVGDTDDDGPADDAGDADDGGHGRAAS